MEGSGTDCVVAWHVSYSIKGERGKACLRENISWAAAVRGGEGLAASRLVFLGIRVFSTGLRVIELLGQEGDSGQVVSMGLLKVTVFFNFFSSIVVTASMRVPGALLGALNSKMLSQSEAACDIRIWGLVSSLKM